MAEPGVQTYLNQASDWFYNLTHPASSFSPIGPEANLTQTGDNTYSTQGFIGPTWNGPQPTQPTSPNPAPAPTVDTGGQTSGPSQEESLVNNIYNETMSRLGEQMNTINSREPQVSAQLQQQYGTSKTALEGERTRGETGLTTSATQAGGRKEDAASAARRLYSELAAGGRQRFGGASSAGQAYSELNNVQQQRNQGDIQKQYTTAISQIEGYRQDLQSKFTTALQQLEDQKNQALNEARNYFDDQRQQIRNMQGDAANNKSTSMLNLLSDLRNKVYAINMQNYQYTQQLQAQHQTTQAAVDQAQQRVMQTLGMSQDTVNQFSNQTQSVPNRLSMANPGGSNMPTYTGQVTPTKKNPWDYTA